MIPEAVTIFLIAVVASTALVTSTLTSLIGAGGGTILLLVMLYIMPAASVIPVHGCIQLMANATRVYLLWQYMQWPVIIRFSVLMPVGVYLGLQLYSYLQPDTIKLVIALAILLSLLIQAPKSKMDSGLPKSFYYVLGIFVGFGNVIVGVLAPLLAAILRLEAFSKEQTVATLGFFGFVGNILKIAGFSAIGFSLLPYWALILPACVATIVGGYLGKMLLLRSSNRLFALLFKIIIALLCLKMIWDLF